MPIFEHDLDLEEMKKAVRNQVCGECGSGLTIAWGGKWGWNEYVLRCSNDIGHKTTKRPFSPNVYEIPGFNLFNLNKGREKMMEQQYGDKGLALAKYHGVVSLTKDEAKEILLTVFPDAPEVELQRAILLCSSYQLNPLMGHVFLIKFNKWNKERTKVIGESWATVVGIKAKRLMASRADRNGRARPYSYVDNTPRVMTEDEQKSIFGRAFNDRLYVITKGKDPITGAEAVGYGFWLNKDSVYGSEKGNSEFNMATIRSESQMLDRLRPGEMPSDVGVVDEEYANAIEAEFKEITPESAALEKPEEEKKGEVELVTEELLAEINKVMGIGGWDMKAVGEFCNKGKGWGIKKLGELTKPQAQELIKAIKQTYEAPPITEPASSQPLM